MLGLAIAAPVGPIGILCIRRTLSQGRLFGFVSGLGAATADAIYGCIAAFGLTAISALLVRQQACFGCSAACSSVISASEPCWPDPPTIRRGRRPGARRRLLLHPAADPHQPHHDPLVRRGLCRPGRGRRQRLWRGGRDRARRFPGLGGVVVPLERRRQPGAGQVRSRAMLWVNRVSGVIILGFGVAALVSLLR